LEENGKQTTVDLKNLKAGGFIKERGRDLFTIRLRVPGGRLSVQRLKQIARVAEQYGGDFVHLSVRQSLELVNINFRDFDAVVAGLGEAGQQVASCGARIRVPVACGGCEYNPNGLMDTQQSAIEVDQALFGATTGHHKFKVGFSGCPHDCPKAAINDVGFVGAVLPELEIAECISCGLCHETCREGAISEGEGKKPKYHPEHCLYCGDCVKVCPSGAWRVRMRGYSVYAGGKWGRSPLVGTLVASFLPGDLVLEIIGEILSWYRDNAEGMGRVRLGNVILKKGIGELLGYLNARFPEHVVTMSAPPTVIDTQLRGRVSCE
jgi:dissimilatory sulfite reductase (desulfoviridin) alpha/beta subunit